VVPSVAALSSPSHGQIRHFPMVDRCACAGVWRQAAIPFPLRRGIGAKTQQSNGRATAPEIAIHRRHLFRSGWQRSTRTRTPASQPHVLSTDSAPCSAMPPTDAVRPTDKNNIVLAIHARWLDEPRSSRKHIFRASASAPALVRPPYWEPRSDGHDWTSGSNPAQTLGRAQCFPVTRRAQHRRRQAFVFGRLDRRFERFLRLWRSSERVTGNSEVTPKWVLSALATIRELSERQDEQRAMIGALLRGLARPGSHAAINNHGQPRYIGRSIAAQP
jgi:hypothetical protein